MSPLTIAIDASRAFQPRPTGTERYSAALIEELVKLGAHRYVLYARGQPDGPVPDGAALRVLAAPRLWTHTALSGALFRDRPDALFVPAHVLPIRYPPLATVVTVHDLGYHHFPDAHPLLRRLYLDWSTRRHARVATRLVAVSGATQRDLIDVYGAAPARIRVVYEAADTGMRPAAPAEVAAARSVLGLVADEPFILAVGTVQPRKNLRRLILAFSRLAAVDAKLHLVVAGGAGWGGDRLGRLAAQLGLGERVHLAGYVPRDMLIALYGGARLVVIPSLYEGFGLPVLEAMACGAPVVTTTGGSLPEIAGDAALVVDPVDVEALAAAMRRVLTDEGLRSTLAQAGRRRAADFSWPRAARETLAVIEEAFEAERRDA